MICRMLTSIASATWSYRAGQEVRSGSVYGYDIVPEDVLRGWVLRNLAAPIPEQRVENAVQRATETAAAPVRRGRPKGR